MNVEELAAQARRAALRAYAPYSRFRVGAIAVDREGNRYDGVNVENAAYGSGVCAEVTAVVTAVSQGVRSIEAVAVACIDAAEADAAYPCGNCRQVMHEFGVRSVIVTAGEGSDVREHTLEELHPHGFSLDD